MTATEDTRNQATATIHCAIDRLLGEAAHQLHAAVQADVNAQARVADLEAVIERLRKEVGILACERDQHHLYEERRAEWIRAERAEAECERLRTGIALARAYKAAVDGPNGVADAEAALFAWLEEIDHVDCK